MSGGGKTLIVGMIAIVKIGVGPIIRATVIQIAAGWESNQMAGANGATTADAKHPTDGTMTFLRGGFPHSWGVRRRFTWTQSTSLTRWSSARFSTAQASTTARKARNLWQGRGSSRPAGRSSSGSGRISGKQATPRRMQVRKSSSPKSSRLGASRRVTSARRKISRRMSSRPYELAFSQRTCRVVHGGMHHSTAIRTMAKDMYYRYYHYY
mmetsp:Transcript_33080/g.105196  ORF Transcript_33080/g.105196 Transcript_33080/m.105196 type:complete len:210 (-) Transcript_33080:7-636(-)